MKFACFLVLTANLVATHSFAADQPSLLGEWSGERDRIAKADERPGGLATLVISAQTGRTFAGRLKRANTSGDVEEPLWGAFTAGGRLMMGSDEEGTYLFQLIDGNTLDSCYGETGNFPLSVCATLTRAASSDVSVASPSDCPTTSDSEKVRLATAWLAAFAEADDGAFDEILAPTYAHHFGIGTDSQSATEFKQAVTEWRRAYEGDDYVIEDSIVGGDMAVVRWTRSGTQIGAFRDVGPSATRTTYSGINIFRIECGRVAESWNESDHLGRLISAGTLTKQELGSGK